MLKNPMPLPYKSFQLVSVVTIALLIFAGMSCSLFGSLAKSTLSIGPGYLILDGDFMVWTVFASGLASMFTLWFGVPIPPLKVTEAPLDLARKNVDSKVGD